VDRSLLERYNTVKEKKRVPKHQPRQREGNPISPQKELGGGGGKQKPREGAPDQKKKGISCHSEGKSNRFLVGQNKKMGNTKKVLFFNCWVNKRKREGGTRVKQDFVQGGAGKGVQETKLGEKGKHLTESRSSAR